PVYYDGVHELPIDQECVKNLQHTEQACFAKSQSKAVSFAVAPKGANFYRSRGYSTTSGNIMLRFSRRLSSCSVVTCTISPQSLNQK
ncbi:hypothetical protein, partial [Serratia sp. (in: enterobacteria)]|uniref:hypothetical protein n=1 Tax=Serratia sp. (in: enterobacteria) TaxID=616 RepID=UPI00398A4100